MSERVSPFLEVKYGWNFGESGWNTGMDQNLNKFSVLLDSNVDGIVNSLPMQSPEGSAYFLTSDNRIYFKVGGVWDSSPIPEGFILRVKETGTSYLFEDGQLVESPDTNDLQASITGIDETLSTLGTAAFEQASSFATTTQVTAVSENLASPNGTDYIGYGAENLTNFLSSFTRNFVSPDSFGAVGDGVTDDSMAFQNAVNSAQTLKLPINLGSKSYAISGVLTTGVSIYSEGFGKIVPVSDAGVLITVTSSGGFTWRNFTFDGKGVSSAVAFNIITGTNVRFDNIDLTGWVARPAIFESGVSGAFVLGGKVYSNTSPDVYCYKGSNGRFQGIHFSDCSEHVLRFGRFSADPAVLSTNNVVVGCTFNNINNDPVLFELDARQGVVVGNVFRSCRRIVKVETTADGNTRDFIISDNMFVTQTGVPLEAIRCFGVVRCTISNNHIDGADQGITAGSESKITGNYLRSITGVGIRHDANSTVCNNVIAVVGGQAIRADTSASSGSTINGNVITSATGNGIDILAPNTIVTANRITTTAIAIRGTSDASYALITGNIVRGSGTGISAIGTGSSTVNNIT